MLSIDADLVKYSLREHAHTRASTPLQHARVHSTQMPSIPLEFVHRVIASAPSPTSLPVSPLTCKLKEIMSRVDAVLVWWRGKGHMGSPRLSFVLEILIEQEVGGQVLVLLAGEVRLDHQSF